MLSSEDLTGSWAAAWDGELVYAARMCLPWGGAGRDGATGTRIAPLVSGGPGAAVSARLRGAHARWPGRQPGALGRSDSVAPLLLELHVSFIRPCEEGSPPRARHNSSRPSLSPRSGPLEAAACAHGLGFLHGPGITQFRR